MHPRAIIIAVIIFGLIILGMFTFAYLKKQEMVESPAPTTEEEPTGEVAYASITRIDAKHFYADGLHTLVGEIPMPTPCELLETDAVVAESMPEQVRVNFNVINNAEACAQVLTMARFKVEVQASEEATFSATFVGRHVELNLIPPLPGETPDDFEIFVKG